MIEKMEKKRLAILRILQKADRPLGSSKIAEQLLAMGHEVSERTVRFYLLAMDKDGLTENFGKKGRCITEQGLEELNTARIFEKVGFLASKIDQMSYRMSFDLQNKAGSIVVNLSILEPEQIEPAIPLISRVFAEGYAMGHLVGLFNANEKIGDITVPQGKIGISTVCSITLNGILLQHAIPCKSRFGGLLELQDKKPVRFVEIINYDGTSLDPLEAFIRSGMTNYTGVTETGNGRIGVSFREVPEDSRDKVQELAYKLQRVGLGGFLTIGWPGQSLLEIPVSEGMVGAIVIGGLNPIALLEEKGIKVQYKALAGLVDYTKLFHFQELQQRVRALGF